MIKAIIGLGNPGTEYYLTRHSIGFQVLDALADAFGATWKKNNLMEFAEITITENPVILIKPLTFMNSSGDVMPFLTKKGIKPEEILVVHDELEMPFAKLKIKQGGSARGHNGLRSIIERIGPDFKRLCFGIARPERREDVADYVLKPFSESHTDLALAIKNAVDLLVHAVN